MCLSIYRVVFIIIISNNRVHLFVTAVYTIILLYYPHQVINRICMCSYVCACTSVCYLFPSYYIYIYILFFRMS